MDYKNMMHDAATRTPGHNEPNYEEFYGGGKTVNPDYGFSYDDEGMYNYKNYVNEIMPGGGVRDMHDPRKIIIYKFSTFVRALVQEALEKGVEINNPSKFLDMAYNEFISYYPHENTAERQGIMSLELQVHGKNRPMWLDLVVDERDKIYDYRPNSWSWNDTTIFNTRPGKPTNYFKDKEKEPEDFGIDRMRVPEEHIDLGYN